MCQIFIIHNKRYDLGKEKSPLICDMFQTSFDLILIFSLYIFSALVALSSTTLADESIDTRENADLTLKCRFNDKYEANDFSFFWTRWTANPAQFDNVAIGEVQLSSGYR